MGGAAKAVGNAFSSPVRALTTVGTFGGSEIARKVSPSIGNMLDMPDKILGFNKSGGYRPQQLGAEDPKLLLAQSGGAPLLSQIALGANVDDALAGYFGRSKGEDWDAYKETLSPDEKAAIDGVRTQLTQIQSNTTLRNQAVQKMVDDFPNIVARTAPAVAQAKQAAGEEFDSATKGYLDYAMRAISAKQAAGGTLSSGATAQAGADSAAKLGLDRLNYTTQAGNQAYDRGAQDLMGSWQANYNEANALRGFQQTMLGQGVQQGFSANQAYLQRKQQTGIFNQDAANQANLQEQKSKDAMFGALGGLAGTVAGAAIAGPAGAAVGRAAFSGAATGGGSAQSYGFSGPASAGYQANNDPRLYGIGR